MATYHFQISSVGRSAGRRATAAAAYRAGERLRDERSGRLYNYTTRRDVLHSEIFLPLHLDGAADAWAGNREKLWNTAERAEKQSNSRVAREYQLSLPHELTTVQQVSLARAFSRELTERYKVAVDLAVHLPRPDGDPRNFHAHLLTTTREVTPRGLGAKAGLDMQSRERWKRELPDVRQEFITLRERWAVLTNEALRAANVETHVDHRSLAARGIDREPRPWFPIASLKIEQRGVRSEVAERIRDGYRRRVQARLERTADRAAQRERGGPSDLPGARSRASPDAASSQPTDAEAIRREAREAWLRIRAKQLDKSEAEHSEHEKQRDTHARDALASAKGHDDDLAL